MVVFRYLAEQNAEGLYLDGVPLRDLTVDDMAGLPKHLAGAVASCPFYVLVTPPASDDAGAVVFVPGAVAGAAARVARRHGGIATKDDSAAADVAAPTVQDRE
jgi:hypothetical protein